MNTEHKACETESEAPVAQLSFIKEDIRDVPSSEPLTPPDPDHTGSKAAAKAQEYVETMLQHNLFKLKEISDEIEKSKLLLMEQAADIKTRLADHFAFAVEMSNYADRLRARVHDVRNGSGNGDK